MAAVCQKIVADRDDDVVEDSLLSDNGASAILD